MKAYKINSNLEVVEVKCPDGMEFPKLDADGDKIYENTHYATKKEALEWAIKSCDSWISYETRHIKELRQGIEESKELLTEYAIARNRLEKELMMLAWQRERSHV